MKTSMRKSLLFTAIFALGFTSQAQVGIGTNTPNASAVLELSSTTKGFLPPRLEQAAIDAILTPPLGLVVYNKAKNCLQVNQADASPNWSDCAIGGAPSGGTGVTSPTGMSSFNYHWATKLRFNEVNSKAGGNLFTTTAVTTDGNAYAWGFDRNSYIRDYEPTTSAVAFGTNPTPNARVLATPFHVSDDAFNGIVKHFRTNGGSLFFIVTTTGEVYGWGDESYNVFGQGTVMGINSSWETSGSRKVAQLPLPAGSNSSQFVDIQVGYFRISALTADGKLYYRGLRYTNDVAGDATNWREIPAPAPGVTYTKMLSSHQEARFNYFMEGSDGKVYSVTMVSGDFPRFRSTSGSSAYPTTQPTTLGGSTVEVQLPTGTVIDKVYSNWNTIIALATDGKAYGWGEVKKNSSSMETFIPVVPAGLQTEGTTTYYTTPKLIQFPAGVTGFKAVTFPHNDKSSVGTFFHGDNDRLYVVAIASTIRDYFALETYSTSNTAAYTEVYAAAGLKIKYLLTNETAWGLGMLDENGVFYGLGRVNTANFGAGRTYERSTLTYFTPTPLFDGNLDSGALGNPSPEPL